MASDKTEIKQNNLQITIKDANPSIISLGNNKIKKNKNR